MYFDNKFSPHPHQITRITMMMMMIIIITSNCEKQRLVQILLYCWSELNISIKIFCGIVSLQ
jgi:hypothetical protein